MGRDIDGVRGHRPPTRDVDDLPATLAALAPVEEAHSCARSPQQTRVGAARRCERSVDLREERSLSRELSSGGEGDQRKDEWQGKEEAIGVDNPEPWTSSLTDSCRSTPRRYSK
eukprot:scaffold2868_cov348-Pavlova_lutheri.AAC.12